MNIWLFTTEKYTNFKLSRNVFSTATIGYFEFERPECKYKVQLEMR